MKVKGVLYSCLLLLMSFAFSTTVVHADVGVGVNLGRIDVDEGLAPGGSYNLPVLGVINTGDEATEYEVVINHLQEQRQAPAPAGWFSLQPERFFLNPKEVQSIDIRVTLPVGADPGEYFALIEAHPKAEGEGVTIGLAAATAVSFSVKPSSWFEAQRVRFNRFLDDNQPWSSLVPASLLVALLFSAVRRFFRIRLQVQRR